MKARITATGALYDALLLLLIVLAFPLGIVLVIAPLVLLGHGVAALLRLF